MKPLRHAGTFIGIAVAIGIGLTGCGGSSSTTKPGPLVGKWGAKASTAELDLTSTGGQFQLLGGCFGGPLNGPVIPDKNGHFNVPGTFSSNIGVRDVDYIGTVNGSDIMLEVVGTNTSLSGTANQTVEKDTLNHGQKPLSFDGGACPG